MLLVLVEVVMIVAIELRLQAAVVERLVAAMLPTVVMIVMVPTMGELLERSWKQRLFHRTQCLLGQRITFQQRGQAVIKTTE